MMITDTLSKVQLASSGDLFSAREEPTYGHIVFKPAEDGSLVGAIGCAAEIVVASPSDAMQIAFLDESSEPSDFDGGMSESGELPMTVLAKGSFRFIVREVKQSFPFPIVVVDELLDDEPVWDVEPAPVLDDDAPKEYNDFEDKYDEGEDDDDDDDDDDEEDDMYAKIPSSDLTSRTLQAMKAIVDQKLNTKYIPISPLEESILKESGMDPNMNMGKMQQDQAEEMAAVFDVFVSSLLDIAPSKIERLYVVGIMAAEFAGLDNNVRRKVLTMVDGVERLRLVLREAEKKIGMVQAKKLTEEIVDKSDEGSKDLQVGAPSLPPWAKNIKKGLKIEYFWNEGEGWCKGEVTETPVMVVDELLLTILFEDGETHRLPFRGDEKARWRPSGMS